jgi:pimeloyl-ACP methyl ester carboxylesterase
MSVSDRGYRRWAARLNALGWSAAFVHLPYHYGRRPPGTLSGEWCLTADLVRSAEALRQMVIELRLVCRAATALGCPHIGLWGTSYGGLAAALLVLLEPAVSTAWLLEPIADVDHAFFESPATIVVRRQLARQGITRADIADYVQLVCPSFHQPLIPPARILLLAGTYDRVTPPAVIRRLHAQWGGSHYAEFPQGHVGYRLMPESLALAQRLMPELFAAR